MTIVAQIRQLKRWQRVLLLLALLLAIAGIVVACATVQFLSWDFRNNLWSPTHLLVTGRSPYRIDVLFENSNTIWMPTAVGAFLPLGFLSQYQATTLWAIFNLLVYFGIVIWATRREKPNPILLAVALLSSFLFPAFVAHMTFGQFSVLSIFLSLLLAECVAKRAHPAWLGLLSVLLLTKPQLAFLVLMGILVYAYALNGRRYVGRFLGFMGLWAIGLTLPLWVLFPNWFEGFLWALGRNYTWLHPSSLLFLQTHLGVVGAIVWAFMVLLVSVINGWFWYNKRATEAVLWSLLLTVLITPYVWSYDFVLVTPLWVFTLFDVRSYVSKGVWVGIYALIWLYFFHLRVNSSNSDELYWWVPLASLLLVVVVRYLDQWLVKYRVLLSDLSDGQVTTEIGAR